MLTTFFQEMKTKIITKNLPFNVRLGGEKPVQLVQASVRFEVTEVGHRRTGGDVEDER